MKIAHLAQLSPLALLNWEIPSYKGARRQWFLHDKAISAPIAFFPVDGDGEHTLQPSGAISASLEFYGGAGLAGNAGGVRCANYAGVQIKGIGRSVLAGATTDKWHKHGALSLQDAIRELVMAELFHLAAPFGAVRAYGIADLGFDFATEDGVQKLPSSAPRALLYREPSVRLAHFMRSSFCSAPNWVCAQELERMRDGIPRLTEYLCNERSQLSMNDALHGLFRIFDNLMKQVAALRTKRLMHGSFIPSNLALDGRILDFTTSTALSTLQPVMVSPGGNSSHQQHRQVLDSLPDLIFYISKFDPRCTVPIARVKQAAKELISELHISHEHHLFTEHLGLLGFSTAQTAKLDRQCRASLLSSLLRVIQQGSTQGHLYFGGDEHSMLPQKGCEDILSVIASAIHHSTGLILPESANFSVRTDQFPPAVTRDFIASFSQAVRMLDPSAGDLQSFGMALLIRAMQRNADLSALYKRNLEKRINAVCRAGEDFGMLIDEIIYDWSGVFECPLDGGVKLEGWLTADAVFLTGANSLQGGSVNLSPLALSTLQPSKRVLNRHRWLFEVAAVNRDDPNFRQPRIV